MKDQKRLRAGVIGSVVMALCCFTPLLVGLLGTAGLSAWLSGWMGWLDVALLSVLALFVCIAAYAVIRMKRRQT